MRGGGDNQRSLFSTLLSELTPNEELVNEVIEITVEDGEAVFTCYALPETDIRLVVLDWPRSLAV